MRLRSIRPDPPPIDPNGNDPASVPPGTVGPPSARPGDPNGVTIEASGPLQSMPRVIASAWSGWPADWWPPYWNGGGGGDQQLSDTAWMCVDLNASVLATMPPYLVGAAVSLDCAWLQNPDPDTYASWEEFCKQAFWDFQLGECFVLSTARYATGWPARFHCVPGWAVQVELVDGIRRYEIGDQDVTDDMLHIRYKSSVDRARGIGPFDTPAGQSVLQADRYLTAYAQGFIGAGGVPTSILSTDAPLSQVQSDQIKADWIAARQAQLGAPAVLSGGVSWQATQLSPHELALVELSDRTQSRVAQMLGVPAPIVGIPVSDPQTYRNVKNFFDFHWRMGLRPKAQTVMSALSAWLLPRGTSVELNRDSYIEPEPLERAQVAQIYSSIRDSPTGPPVLSVDEIRTIERMEVAGHAGVPPPTTGTETAGA